MSELLRVLVEEGVDDEALQEAAAAAHAVLEARDVPVEGVAPVLHEGAADAGQQAIDDVVGDSGPKTTLILGAVDGPTRRLRIRPHPDPGAVARLREDEWTGCAWRLQGTEPLDRVEIDSAAYHGDELVEEEAGP